MLLERGLAALFEQAFRLPQSARTEARAVALPQWPGFLARFLVHFIKGVFVGAGMYTADALLATGRIARLAASTAARSAQGE